MEDLEKDLFNAGDLTDSENINAKGNNKILPTNTLFIDKKRQNRDFSELIKEEDSFMSDPDYVVQWDTDRKSKKFNSSVSDDVVLENKFENSKMEGENNNTCKCKF